MKIGMSEAAGSNHSSMYDTRPEFSNASPELLSPSIFTPSPRLTRHPTPITDSIDSSSISCPYNNLGRRVLEVRSRDLLLLLRTENLQPRRLGSHMLFPPRWAS